MTPGRLEPARQSCVVVSRLCPLVEGGLIFSWDTIPWPCQLLTPAMSILIDQCLSQPLIKYFSCLPDSECLCPLSLLFASTISSLFSFRDSNCTYVRPYYHISSMSYTHFYLLILFQCFSLSIFFKFSLSSEVITSENNVQFSVKPIALSFCGKIYIT